MHRDVHSILALILYCTYYVLYIYNEIVFHVWSFTIINIYYDYLKV